VRMAQPEDHEAPVAHEVPPRPSAIADYPAQGGDGEEPRLTGIARATQGRTPVTLTL
jgi:hypothetical protein